MTTEGVGATDATADQTSAPRSRRFRNDRGEVIEAIVVLTTVLITTMLIVQFGLALHARQVMAGAAQDGAAAGAAADSSPGAGLAITNQLVNSSAGGLVDSYSSSVSASGTEITVTVRGNAPKVFPLFPTFTLSASSSATIEEFRPQAP